MQIEAYVIVSDDDMICDAEGVMPESLKNDADWAFFQAGLDAADVCVLGRLNHELTPNPKRRRRLVLTRSVEGIVRDKDAAFWNPADKDLNSALASFEMDVNHLAVVGGQAIFDFFLSGSHRYTRFHLSRIAGLRIPNGRTVFSGVGGADGVSAEAILRRNGYSVIEKFKLDEEVEVESWG